MSWSAYSEGFGELRDRLENAVDAFHRRPMHGTFRAPEVVALWQAAGAKMLRLVDVLEKYHAVERTRDGRGEDAPELPELLDAEAGALRAFLGSGADLEVIQALLPEARALAAVLLAASERANAEKAG